MRAALAAGVAVFGENRVQEAEAKAPALGGARWELVGRLQGNKAARAVVLFGRIHSIDSLELAQRVARAADAAGRAPLPVFVQVNVDRDPAKGGFEPADLEATLPRIVELPGIQVRGLMTVGRLVARPEDARLTFRGLSELSQRLQTAEPRLGPELSMGMSDDFEVAVEEGATVVRLGRVLFGERPGA
jgi:PLP dependent protein